eukprot:6213511-Pleurochrysis_carterae.AAC.5
MESAANLTGSRLARRYLEVPKRPNQGVLQRKASQDLAPFCAFSRPLPAISCQMDGRTCTFL